MSESGSITTKTACPRRVRCTPGSRQWVHRNETTLRASCGLMHCSNQDRYSITSSALTSSDEGIVRLSAFAVLRLITSSSLLGN